jgi:hypothetical protein
MGYLFKKKGDEHGFDIRLYDAGVVRAAAGPFEKLMPEPNGDGGKIPDAVREPLVHMFREQSEMLKELADYIAWAEDLEWTH